MNETWWVSENQLDTQQKRIPSLRLDGNFLISGPPGSGKTNLLLLRAKFLTLAGKPNLKIILFTRALREFIASGADNYAFNTQNVVTSHAFWSNLLYEYDVSRPEEDTFEKQRNALVERVTRLVRQRELSNLYEAILLDEAHDFLPEEVELFSLLARNIFAVADRRQKIYSGEAPFSVLEKVTDEHIELIHHYRNGFNVCLFADTVGQDRHSFNRISDTSNYDEQRQPSTVIPHKCENLEEEIDLLLSKLDDQLKAYPRDVIGIISPSRSAIARVWERIEESPYRFIASYQGSTQNLSFDGHVRIFVSTLHAAKGLECRALHVVSCENFRRRPLPRALVFTAATRAKTTLDLYYSSPLLGFLEQSVSSLTPQTNLPDLTDLFGKE